MTGIRDAANHPDTTFLYDALGHVKQTNFPVGSEFYTYDQLGNLKTKLDRNGKLTTYNYDSLDRLKNKIYDDSSEIDYTYDNDGRDLPPIFGPVIMTLSPGFVRPAA